MSTRPEGRGTRPVAKRVLDNWSTLAAKFVKVMTVDYKKALEKIALEKKVAEAGKAA